MFLKGPFAEELPLLPPKTKDNLSSANDEEGWLENHLASSALRMAHKS